MPKLLLGQYTTGLQRNVEPYWLPNEAYETIEDAYVWRGRTRRKEGYAFLGRLHDAGVTGVPIACGNMIAGDFTFTATFFAAGDLPLSPGTITISVAVGIALWPPVITFVDNGNGSLRATNAPIAGGFTLAWGLIDYNSGTFILYIDPLMPAGGPYAVTVTAFRHVSHSPCMGLGTYEQDAVNQERLFAFDEVRGYLYNSGTEFFDVTTNAAAAENLWSGSDSDFVWTANYYRDSGTNKLFWATNNVANTAGPPIQNGIQIFNGAFWYAQTPALDAIPNQLRGCLMLIPYRGRMVALNTLEGLVAPNAAVRYANRARWSQNGVPYTTTLGGADANAWRSDIVGRGGYIDAPTNQAIVSAAFNKDTLIVFFERSTWQLRYTGLDTLPFVWETIDIELGAESTFSSIIFDKGILSIADRGIVAANSIAVERIDQKIPDFAFEIENENNGPARVHGIRDYYKKLVYWAYPNDDDDPTFPNKVLCFNHEESAYSIFNDTFTCFGYWQATNDITWATIEAKEWASWTDPWTDASLSAYFPNICAGNQIGFVSILNSSTINDPFADLNVTVAIPNTISNTNPAICQVVNHNLFTGQFVKISNTRAFPIVVAGEITGIASAATTSFSGTLANQGLIVASTPIPVGGPPYISFSVGVLTFTDMGNGILVNAAGVASGTIDYVTGRFTLTYPALAIDTPVLANYSYNGVNNRTFYIRRDSANTFALFNVAANDFKIGFDATAFAAYTGWGEVSQVSNFFLRTKRYNPFLEQGASVRINYIDLLFDKSKMFFKTYINANSDDDQSVESFDVSCLPEDGSTLEKATLWKRVFANTVSDFIQLEFTMSDYTMTQQDFYEENFVLQTMLIDFQISGRNVNRS